MATYVVRKGRVMAKVNIRPFKIRAKTFGSRAEAETWAANIEAQLRGIKTDPQATLAPREIIKHGATVSEAVANLPRLDLGKSSVGVYFLFYQNRCVYVGQSRNLHTRVLAHRLTKKFDSYSWITCSIDDLDRLERFYIEALNPPLNTALTDRIIPVAKERARNRHLRRVFQKHHISKAITTSN